MRTLYVGIDESGNVSRGTEYAVAGCWFVSDRSNPNNVLTPTKERLLDLVDSHRHNDGPISELKGASLAPAVLDGVVPAINEYSYRDQTIETSSLPWEMSIPISFSLCTVAPHLANETISHIHGDPLSSPTTVKTVCLNSVLTPLFYSMPLSIEIVSEIVVLLDSDTWSNPAQKLQRSLSSDSSPDLDIDFRIRDSMSTPGIQMADIAVYSWLRNLRKGDCRQAAARIHNWRFVRS